MAERYDTVVTGGLVVSGSGMVRADVGIAGGKVVAVAPDLATAGAGRVIDAQGKYVLPGAIDVHTHPVYLDDLGSISVTAAHGGVTTMIHYATSLRQAGDAGCGHADQVPRRRAGRFGVGFRHAWRAV